ncbi:MAG: ATP-binding protein [Microscillaceae bacterium]|nr:ATP-binding protein [Microscillaceae bacterium]
MTLAENARTLHAELEWFEKLLSVRMELFNKKKKDDSLQASFLLENQAPDLRSDSSNYAFLVQNMYQECSRLYKDTSLVCMHTAERVLLILTLIPHIKPHALDVFYITDETGREFTQFGGTRGHYHKGFIPTGETALFILAGNNLELRFSFQKIFSTEHFFFRTQILSLQTSNSNEPYLSGNLEISKEYLQLLTTSELYEPDYSTEFPAQRIQTRLSWDDLVLDYHARQDVEEVKAWIKHYKTLMLDPALGREIYGYRCLFYGESGTGKTLTTMLLGKEVDLAVYRIDLSKIVSKYIGETEKNLGNIFTQAKNKDWILFFDEGESLFGKRTQTKSSNDRYANQEVAYLLQKIEEHPGIIILATNIRSNMDKAFIRRFQSEVYFAIPDTQSRLLLWEKAFQGYHHLDKRIDLQAIAEKYEMTGAAIKNVRNYCVIMSKDRQTDIILYEDFREGLRKQLDKEGKKL